MFVSSSCDCAKWRLYLGVLTLLLVTGFAWTDATDNAAAGASTASRGWPEFRGPWGNGLANQPGDQPTGLPLQWSETENVVWKTPIPFQGWSTPVVLNGQIWLTTATPEGNDFFAICVDVATGQIQYNEKLFHSDTPEPLGNDVNSYASPSPVIEPGRVYVHFGSYGTACLDTGSKKVIWSRNDMPCRHYRGPGSSAILFENLLILTFDGADVQYLIALDKTTGKTIWKTDRSAVWQDLDPNGKPVREGDFRKAFTTPLVAEVNGTPQLFSPGSYGAFAYNARTGQEIWKVDNDCYSPAARAVYGNGLAYLCLGRGKAALWAMRPDGQGDVTNSHLAWKLEGKQVPTEPSPILLDDLLYLVSNDGVATCLEAATGVQLWSERMGGNYDASPVYADGRIYCCSTQGKTTVLKAGRTYEVLAENRLDGGFMASPAVDGKAFIFRTKTDLYRIENKQPE